MLNNLDNIYREIEALSIGSAESLKASLGASNCDASSSGITVFKKKISRSDAGIVDDRNDVIIDKVTLGDWNISELGEFFSAWAESNYSSESFDRLIIHDNYQASDIEIAEEIISAPLTISLVKYSKVLFSNPANMILFDMETNIADSKSSDGDGTFDNSEFQIRPEIDTGSFNSVKLDVNFIDASGKCAFWLSLIRDHNDPSLIAGAIPDLVSIRVPSYDISSSTDDHNETHYYNLNSKWHALDIMGYDGDNSVHGLGGYSWGILTDSLSTGTESRAYGRNSISFLDSAIAVGSASLSAMDTVAGDLNSATFGKGNEASFLYDNFIIDGSRGGSVVGSTCGATCADGSASILVSISIPVPRSNGYSVAANQNEISIFDAMDIGGNIVKKAITGTVIESTIIDGGYVLVIKPNETGLGPVVSGKIVRTHSVAGGFESSLVIGQYNVPSSRAIFQIGTGTSDDSRATFLEIGKGENGTIGNIDRIFHIDNSHINITSSKINLLGNGQFEIAGTGMGTLFLNNRKVSMVSDAGWKLDISSDMTYIGKDYQYIALRDGETSQWVATSDISISSETGMSISGGNDVYISTNPRSKIEIGDATGKDILFSSVTSDVMVNDVAIDVSRFYISTAERCRIYGNGRAHIRGGLLDIKSVLNFYGSRENYSKLWTKNPATSFSHLIKSASNTGKSIIDYSGLYRLIDTHGISVPDSTSPGSLGNHIIANRRNGSSMWLLGSDRGTGKGIWTSEVSSSGDSDWRRLAYTDEVSAMGMRVDYVTTGAFALFNDYENGDNAYPVHGRMTNFGVINDVDFLTDTIDSSPSTTKRFLSIDYGSNGSSFVNMSDTNDGSDGRCLMGLKAHGTLENGYIVHSTGTMNIDVAAFSKIGNVVYFDINITVNEPNDDISSTGGGDSAKEFGIMALIGKDYPELCPVSSVYFDQQTRSHAASRYKMRISPVSGRETVFIIHRHDEMNMQLHDEQTDSSSGSNEAGLIGSNRLHFTGQYTSRNDTFLFSLDSGE